HRPGRGLHQDLPGRAVPLGRGQLRPGRAVRGHAGRAAGPPLRAVRHPGGGAGGRGRPELFTSYERDQAPLNTPAKRVWFGLLLAGLLLFPFSVTAELTALGATALLAAVGAIGLNLVTGYAGQVSLGHAFFLGLGAYTAAVISGDPTARTLGYGITEIWIWLPAAGVVAAVAGVIVAPLATRLRGLYLAIVTLGLGFIGQHFFESLSDISGGTNIGRPAPVPVLFGQRIDVTDAAFTKDQKVYWLMFAL